MSQPTTAARSVEIAASPAAVYDLVSNITRTGEWSPECVRGIWIGEPGQQGSTFMGSNRLGPGTGAGSRELGSVPYWSSIPRSLAVDDQLRMIMRRAVPNSAR